MADANATQAITPLDAGLKNLKETIDEKAPSDDFRTIVHYEVHPNIKEAFNLQVIRVSTANTDFHPGNFRHRPVLSNKDLRKVHLRTSECSQKLE